MGRRHDAGEKRHREEHSRISAAGTSVRIKNSTVSDNLGPILRDLGYAWDYRLPAAIEADSLEIDDSTVADNCSGCGPVSGLTWPVVSANFLVASGTVLANPGSGNINCASEVASSGGHDLDSDGSCGLGDPSRRRAMLLLAVARLRVRH